MAGRVVILNGTSSAGKTTLARRFREERAAEGDCWLLIAIDDFNWLLPHQWFRGGGHQGPFSDDGLQIEPSSRGPVITVGDVGRRLFSAYRRTAALWARSGFNVIVDDVAFDEEAVRDWQEALAGLSVTWVAVHCRPEVAESRERDRGDRMTGLARALSTVVHRHAPCDVEIDTTETSVAEATAQLTTAVCAASSAGARSEGLTAP